MNTQIENFLEKFNEMLEEANKIQGFTWEISVSIRSDNSLLDERIQTINGINKLFSKNNMSWSSNSN